MHLPKNSQNLPTARPTTSFLREELTDLELSSFQQCTEGSLPKRAVETLADDRVVIQSLLLFEVELKKSNSYDGYLLPKNA